MTLTKAQRAAAQAEIDAAVEAAVRKALDEQKSTLVAAQEKPELVKHLRATWRNTGQHYKAQITRFLLVFAGTLAPQLLSGASIDAATVKAIIPAALLVAVRQVLPELGAAQVDSAPGVTIVPSQVGVATADVPIEDAAVEVALPDEPEGGGPPDAGQGLIGLLGAVLAVVGVILVLIAAIQAHALSVPGLVIFVVGVACMFADGDRLNFR